MQMLRDPLREMTQEGGERREDGGMRVVVVSDTHAPRRWKSCPPAVAAYLRGADLILHAGDVCTAAVLDELSGYAPVRAVLGNNDGPDVAAWGAPPELELDLDGLPTAMIHDSGARTGRLLRMRRRFPGARPGGVRALAHPAQRGRRSGADLQPGLADRPARPAAGHDRRAADRGRAARLGRHLPGEPDAGSRARGRTRGRRAAGWRSRPRRACRARARGRPARRPGCPRRCRRRWRRRC